MKIIKYKKMSSGKYKVELDNGSSLVLYEDVILKFELLLKKEIDSIELEDINNENMKYDVYYVALTSLKSRMKSIYDLKEFLVKKDYPIHMIDEAVNKLTEQGYLDDSNYVRCYINNQIITTSNGPYKIKKDLLDKSISSNLIDEGLCFFSDDLQLTRIEKIVNKKLKTNTSMGGTVLRKKIYNDLNILGYDINLINKVLDSINFGNNIDLAKKEYDKLVRRYSRKYSGYELKRVVREKMYQRGLKYEEDD